jgi:hypothetical protein
MGALFPFLAFLAPRHSGRALVLPIPRIMSSGLMFKQGFEVLMQEFGGPISVHRDFGTDKQSSATYRGMKNNEKNNPNKIMFQFPELVDVRVGDVLQQEGARDLWEVYEVEDKVISGTFINLNAWVHKVEGMIGRTVATRPGIVIRGDLNFGDKYTAGQAGAMGPQAHAHDLSLHQISAQQLGQIDMRVLATELKSLRREMRQAATEPEQDIAVGQIASAEAAAQKGDTSSVIRHLKDAGKWAFDVATKIGVTVASEAIKKSAGL